MKFATKKADPGVTLISRATDAITAAADSTIIGTAITRGRGRICHHKMLQRQIQGLSTHIVLHPSPLCGIIFVAIPACKRCVGTQQTRRLREGGVAT